MIEVIKDKIRWNSVIDGMPSADFYHTYDYHHLSKKDGENPVLILYKENDNSIALPLLIREIENTPYFDATSAYGYSGPVANLEKAKLLNSSFHKHVKEYFSNEAIVSVFSRLNPFIPEQEALLSNLGQISAVGHVVNIDLSLSVNEQLKGYHKRLKTYINKARRHYHTKLASSPEDVDAFIEFYYENMKRVGAQPYYFFKRSYFHELFNCDHFGSDLLLASDKETGEIIGGAWFITKNGVSQYHVSGVNSDYLKLNPLKLLIDEMRNIGNERGYRHINLGGGVGNSEDSLYQFKSGFSKQTKPFKLWKLVVDQKIYDDLVSELINSEHYQINNHRYPDFFPFYRLSK